MVLPRHTTTRNVHEPYGLAVDVDRRVVERLHTGEVLADPVEEGWSGIPNRFLRRVWGSGCHQKSENVPRAVIIITLLA